MEKDERQMGMLTMLPFLLLYVIVSSTGQVRMFTLECVCAVSTRRGQGSLWRQSELVQTRIPNLRRQLYRKWNRFPSELALSTEEMAL